MYINSTHAHIYAHIPPVGTQTIIVTQQPAAAEVDPSPLPRSSIFGKTKNFYFTESLMLSLIFCLFGGCPALCCTVPAIFLSLSVRLPRCIYRSLSYPSIPPLCVMASIGPESLCKWQHFQCNQQGHDGSSAHCCCLDLCCNRIHQLHLFCRCCPCCCCCCC